MQHSLRNYQLIATTFLLSCFFALPQSIQAQIQNPVIGNLGTSTASAEDGKLFTVYLISIWNSVISLGAIAVLIYFIWGAFEWLSAGGDSGKTEKARSRISNAIIGLLILTSTFVIVNFISALFFGDSFNILNLQIDGAQNSVK